MATGGDGSSLVLDELGGAAARPHREAIARLRMQIFAEWPYLYDGSLEYEEAYLEQYLSCPDSLIVLARDGERVVGATTAIPLEAAEADMQAPWRQRNEHLENFLYFGESVVLPDYRGRGLGRRFFAVREAHARALGRRRCCFCSVQRPDDHPMKPEGYVPNDAFWQRLGYERLDSLVCHFPWTDIGDRRETQKPLVFWHKRLE